MYFGQLAYTSRVVTSRPAAPSGRARPFTRMRRRVAGSISSRPMSASPVSASASGSPWSSRAAIVQAVLRRQRQEPGRASEQVAHTRAFGVGRADHGERSLQRECRASGGIAAWMPRPIRAAFASTPARR